MSDEAKALRALLEEQELCRNRMGDTKKYPDIDKQYLEIVKAINALAAALPPAP